MSPMLNKSIRILNFDDSIITQARIMSSYKTEILGLTDFASRARLWMNNKTREAIKERIQGSDKSSITFLGSGDFHHVSNVLINEVEGEFSLIIFDFHPDWDTLPPRFGCGSWVSTALKNKNILKCILIGVSSADISSGRMQTASLGSLKNDRLDIYPYLHQPSLVFLKNIPENISLKIKRGPFYNKIYWSQLKASKLEEFFLSLLKRLPSQRAYISIDKDCLKRDYALTNWEEGCFSLEELLVMLKAIKENLDVVGMDIVGDYSQVAIRGKTKNILSRLDHPKHIAAQASLPPDITAINESTNLKILDLFYNSYGSS